MKKILLEKLNNRQKEAVLKTEGSILVIAGAGSGKTSVLIARFLQLITNGIYINNILAITFTNKAANEIKKRVKENSNINIEYSWISTFHSFCARLLRMEVENLKNHSSTFTIYDEQETRLIIKNCLNELNLDEKLFNPTLIKSIISKSKNNMVSYNEFRNNCNDFFNKEISKIYELYEKKLIIGNAMDFDDLLLYTIKLLNENSDVKNKYQNKFKYILVDEYQDTNKVQYNLLKILAQKNKNFFAVGDVDQSIYSWRGADISNILQFKKDYPEAHIIKLEQNYRSTKFILDAANAIIKNNIERTPKKLWTENKKGEKIIVYNASDEKDEANFIVKTLVKKKKGKIFYNDYAVLYRINAQSRAIEEGFLQAGIPYTIVGGIKFYERKEIKDILAYLKVVNNPNDLISLQRIINIPRRGIGNTSIKHIDDFSKHNNISFFEALSFVEEISNLTPKAKMGIKEFLSLVFKFDEEKNKKQLDDFIEYCLKKIGYLIEFEQNNTMELQLKIENLKEFIGVAKDFIKKKGNKATLEEFLTHVSLITDLDILGNNEDKVFLMTIHSAKGLEFKNVFLVGMEEGVLPHIRSLTNEKEMEEERRLCYVGITRACNNLFIIYTRMRSLFGNLSCNMPSRFLNEIPENCIIKVIQSEKSNIHKKNTILSKNIESFLDINQINKNQSNSWKIRDKIFHKEFGQGTLVDLEKTNGELIIKVAFANIGIKSLMAKYAPITKI